MLEDFHINFNHHLTIIKNLLYLLVQIYSKQSFTSLFSMQNKVSEGHKFDHSFHLRQSIRRSRGYKFDKSPTKKGILRKFHQ